MPDGQNSRRNRKTERNHRDHRRTSMSDHIDGPRQIGDPSADLTDLFAFSSPENPSHFVIATDVFPSAGLGSMFSNAINHSLVIRRVKVAAVGNEARFTPDDEEFRFSCRFGPLERDQNGKVVQHGTLTCPDKQELRLLVNDEKGSSTPDGT